MMKVLIILLVPIILVKNYGAMVRIVPYTPKI